MRVASGVVGLIGAYWISRLRQRLRHGLAQLQQAQAAVRLSEARFRTLMKATAAGILLRDRIAWLNPWLRELCGLEADASPPWPELICECNGDQLRLCSADQRLCWVSCVE